MARAAHKPTEATRSEVKALASFGVIEDDIATYIGVSAKTLRKHYRRELDTAVITANARVAKRLFEHATKDSVPAAIFWMKARAGWREKLDLEHTGPGGGPIQSITTTTTDPVEAANLYLKVMAGGQ